MKQLLEKPILTEGRYSAYIDYGIDVMPVVVVRYEEPTSPFTTLDKTYRLSDELGKLGYWLVSSPYAKGELFGVDGRLLVAPNGEVVLL